MPALTETITKLGRVALDLLYPPRCAVCGAGGSFLCQRCEGDLPVAHGARCDACWLPLGPDTPCRRCAERPLAFTRLRSAFRYEAGARKLVQALKFQGQSALGEIMAALVADAVVAGGLDAADAIVPVPLAGARLKERGYNQAQVVASAVGRRLEMPVAEVVRRTRSTRAQARSATAVERFRNVEGAFAAQAGAGVRGRRLLVLDDVATTGATLDACARTLLAAGAAEVWGVTFARED